MKDISEKKKALEHLQHKVSHLEPQVEQLQQEKDHIRHRAKYWKQRCDELKSMHEGQQVQEIVEQQQKIEELIEEVEQLERDNFDLRETVEEIMVSNDDILTFQHGKYTDDIRACCYERLSLNAGVRNVAPVIKAVLEN